MFVESQRQGGLEPSSLIEVYAYGSFHVRGPSCVSMRCVIDLLNYYLSVYYLEHQLLHKNRLDRASVQYI